MFVPLPAVKDRPLNDEAALRSRHQTFADQLIFQLLGGTVGADDRPKLVSGQIEPEFAFEPGTVSWRLTELVIFFLGASQIKVDKLMLPLAQESDELLPQRATRNGYIRRFP